MGALLPIEAWAFIRPDGSFLVDSSFEDEKQVWMVGLGWPSLDEIESFKKSGYRVERLKVYI